MTIIIVTIYSVSMFFPLWKERANGLAHLTPILARRQSAKITFSTQWPPHPRAEGGQVEPVFGSSLLGVFFVLQPLTNLPPFCLKRQTAKWDSLPAGFWPGYQRRINGRKIL
jgi:hypothetical protein